MTDAIRKETEQDAEVALQNIAELLDGYAAASSGGVVMYPGDFLGYSKRVRAALQTLLADRDALRQQLSEAQADRERLRAEQARDREISDALRELMAADIESAENARRHNGLAQFTERYRNADEKWGEIWRRFRLEAVSAAASPTPPEARTTTPEPEAGA